MKKYLQIKTLDYFFNKLFLIKFKKNILLVV